jgi:hypothetical protein
LRHCAVSSGDSCKLRAPKNDSGNQELHESSLEMGYPKTSRGLNPRPHARRNHETPVRPSR